MLFCEPNFIFIINIFELMRSLLIVFTNGLIKVARGVRNIVVDQSSKRHFFKNKNLLKVSSGIEKRNAAMQSKN